MINEQVLFGSILGDGHIEKGRKYRETHSIKQKEYALWKAKYDGWIDEW